MVNLLKVKFFILKIIFTLLIMKLYIIEESTINIINYCTFGLYDKLFLCSLYNQNIITLIQHMEYILLNINVWYYDGYYDLDKENGIIKCINYLSNYNLIIKKVIFTYYCIKYKQKFINWLWYKVREKKIISKYSPINLVILLNNTNDIDFQLKIDNW